jgi:hypothetical protein
MPKVLTEAKNSHSHLWAVWGNGYGLRGPLKVYKSDILDDAWWAKNGNDEVTKQGIDFNDGCFSFASPDPDEVQAFIQGYSACAKIVREATSMPKKLANIRTKV